MKRHFQYSRRQKCLLALVALATCLLLLAVSRHTARARQPAFSSFGSVKVLIKKERPIPFFTPDTSRLLTLGFFLHKMDSLQLDENGRRQYDSFNRTRPGLIDSVRTALRYYSLLQY